jgi:hypothetical protein
MGGKTHPTGEAISSVLDLGVKDFNRKDREGREEKHTRIFEIPLFFQLQP